MMNSHKHNHLFSPRKGITIIMVIIVGMSLMAMAVILLVGGTDNREKVLTLKEKYQSYFLAVGGQQHALLKFRLLPTPFYDAAAYAIGKNPYYDFTRSMDRYNNPGPMFFTGNVTVEETVEDAGQEMLIISRDDSWNLTPQDETFEGVMATHLNRFLKDIRSDYPTGNGVVVISSTSHDDKAMGPGWYDPYSGSYFVDKVFIFGSQGALSYSTDSVMVSCRGEAMRANHKSIITERGGSPRDLTRQFLKHTSGQAGGGFDEQVDMEVSNQEKFDFLQQYEDELASNSARRGEAVTSVYEVQREK